MAQKTPILDKYDPNKVYENDDEDFGSFSEEDGSYSLSDFEEHEDPKDQYSKIDKIRDRRRSHNIMKERAKSNLVHNKDNYKTETWNKEKTGNNKESTPSKYQYLKKYK